MQQGMQAEEDGDATPHVEGHPAGRAPLSRHAQPDERRRLPVEVPG